MKTAARTTPDQERQVSVNTLSVHPAAVEAM